MNRQENSKIAWMVKNSVAANLLMLIFVVGGFFALTKVKQEIFPDFNLDVITVSVAYPSASPEEVENGIIIAVEDVVQGLDNVKEVLSTAKEGVGTVAIEMIEGGDIQQLANDIKNAVDGISSFPEDAEYPTISIVSRKVQVIEFCLYGDITESEMYDLADTVRDEMLQLKDVTSVDITGTRTPEISVEVPMYNVRGYGLTLNEISSRIGKSSLEMPGGSLKTKSGEIMVKVDERRDYGREFESLPIIYTGTGTPITLSEIGTVIDGFEDKDSLSLWNGKRSVFIRAFAMDNQTPIQVADAVVAYMDDLKDRLPAGIEIAVSHCLTDTYKDRISLLLKNGFMGWCLVVLLLALFLDYRLAFWVALGIPISFMGTILLMPITGASINMMTLFAFIVSLGIVVDDAIIVGENVYALREKGMSWGKSAIEGAKEVAVPVTFSILTNIVAFCPLFFIPGTLGKIYFQVPIIVIVAFSISLIESLFILPAHLAAIKDGKRNFVGEFVHSHQQAFSFWFKNKVENTCTLFIEKVIIRFRYIVIAIGIALLLASLSLPASRRIGMVLSPKVEADFARAVVYLPFGTSKETTQLYTMQLLKAGLEITAENGGEQLVEGNRCMIGETAGGGTIGSHYTEVRFHLTDSKIRPISTDEFTNLWRERTGLIIGAESYTFESDSDGPGSGSSITVQLSHQDINVLKAAGEELAEALAQYPNTSDINDGYADGKPQLNYKINDKGRLLGFTASDIASQMRAAFYGAEAIRQQRGRAEVKVMVRLPEDERQNETTINDFIVISSTGNQVYLSDIADVERGRAYTNISRKDGRRIINVTANVTPQSQTNEVIASLNATVIPQLEKKYQGLNCSYSGRQEDMKESLSALQSTFMIAFFAIYALIAIPFKSYLQPAIIMFVIPFGAVGAIFGHMLMGYSISLMSMFGIIALAGVVVNDSLVLIELANRRRELGDDARHAIKYAANQRIRPVMLTTLTTFFGLAPMIFETSRQARFLIPMAISLGYGILFATAITLLMVPSLYIIIEDIMKFLGINTVKKIEDDTL